MKKLFKKGIIWLLVLSCFIEATPVWALTKEENIYTKLNSNGTTTSTIIYEHLKGIDSSLITDKSFLDNITNINGDEKFTKEDNKLTWTAKGNDIYYTGTTDKDLPIKVSIKYYLNDKEYEAKDLLGQKGHIKIVIKYENTLKNNVFVNNRLETLYTPFVIATTSFLSNTTNHNIKITNGKAIDNGNATVVLGISSPGLYESLNIEELKGLDTVELSYDTDSFELSSIYAVATSKVLEDDDLNILNQLKGLYGAIDELQSNMNLLVVGSKQIADGTNELNNAVSNIADKYYQYRNISKEDIINKLTPILETNMEKLAPALQERVVSEAEKVLKANKGSMALSIADIAAKNTKDVIEGEIDKLLANINIEDILDEIIGGHLTDIIMSNNNIVAIANSFREALNEQIAHEISTNMVDALSEIGESLDIEMSDTELQAYIQNLATTYGVTFEQAAAIAGQVQEDTLNTVGNGVMNNLDTISTGITNKVISNLNDSDYVGNLIGEYIANVNDKIAVILGNDPNIADYQVELIQNIANYLRNELTKEQLINRYLEASEYINNVTDSIIDKTANDLANQYTVEMTKQIINNMINEELNNINVKDELSKILDKYEDVINDKLNIIDDNVNKLTNGVSMLNDGANLLANGLNMYNEQGIKRISSLVNGDVKTIANKIDALIKLSNEYKTFDEIENNTEGKSKIIFMIDSLKKQEDKKITTEKIVESNSLWDKIKGLFK